MNLRPVNLIRQESGQALIEFALISTLFLLLFAGIVDYGIYIHQQMELNEAAAAAAAYGTIPGNQKATANMQTLALYTAGDVSGMTAASIYFYSCTPGSTHVASTYACNSTFDSNPLMYVQVTTNATVPAALKWSGISSSLTLQGQATYRVAWVQ